MINAFHRDGRAQPASDISQSLHRRPFCIGFLMLENFSLTCFSQSLDVLATANLVRPGSVKVQTFSRTESEVMSDLGIPIRPDTPLTDIRISSLDLMIVCGGFRTPRVVSPWLISLLQRLARFPVTLGGIWNGAWYLGKSGLLDGYRCAIHSEQRVALAEHSPNTSVTQEIAVCDRDRLTAATPAGAFQMMVRWLSVAFDQTLADGVVALLDYDQSRFSQFVPLEKQPICTPIRDVVMLMEANLEDPLDPAQLASSVGLSVRQVQRLFKEELNTTPQKHYLYLRISAAKRLIQNSRMTMVDVALACGFVSASHFSRCYSELVGHAPSKETRYEI